MPLRIAHRGMPRRSRENTLPSFALALDAGADGIELDVHATSDGLVVVHHDEKLRDRSRIVDRRYEEIREQRGEPEFTIPTLSDVCALVAGRATLFVELKGRDVEDAVVAVLDEYRGDVAIHSFDHAMIARLSAAGCRHRLGVLFEGAVDDLETVMEDTGALDVWPHFPLVRGSLVDAVHARGGRVIPWTVNDAGVARRLASLGVDGLCGDDVTIFDA